MQVLDVGNRVEPGIFVACADVPGDSDQHVATLTYAKLVFRFCILLYLAFRLLQKLEVLDDDESIYLLRCYQDQADPSAKH